MTRWKRDEYGVVPRVVIPGGRWPFQPLEDWLRHTHQADLSAGDIAEILGTTRRSIHRYRRDGLTDSAADRYATRLEQAPWLLWARWHDALQEAA